jgi:hypothetical protein
MKKSTLCSAHTLAALAVAALTLGVSVGAHAQYRDLDADADTATQLKVVAPVSEEAIVSAQRGKLTQVGTPKGSFTAIKGFGKEVKLVEALKVVVPAGWNARKSGSVDINQPVTLATSSNWVEAVASFAEQTQTAITVDWDEKVVTVQGAPKAVTTSGYIKLADVAATAKVITDEKSKTAEEVAPPPPLPKWTLAAGKSLRDNVEGWANASSPKYVVKWRAVNYMIDAAATFEGAFDDENNGPIATVVNLFSKSDVPLKATFLEDNRVLLIENAGYRQDAARLAPFNSSSEK